MIEVGNLIDILKKNRVDFFTGVPDSILKKFSIYIDNYSQKKHVVATNEGSATSIGIGYYLSTKRIPCIYLQNSGLSNAINPLISISSKEVYSIPLLLLIGWRGSPRQPDEPQHKAKGKITTKLLKLLNINFCILRKEKDLLKIKNLIKNAYKNKKIVACLIEKNILTSTSKKIKKLRNKFVLRSEFIENFLKSIPKKSKIISTTGYTSRELMDIRKNKKISNGQDFYMVGGMGHSASVALGYTLHSNKTTYCLDGDGSALMHLGSLRTVGFLKNKNFKHIILNNNSHESVGGQPTHFDGINLEKFSKSIGYKNYFQINNKRILKKILKKFLASRGPSLLEVKIQSTSLKNLSRPKDLIRIKENFMKK